MIRWLMGRKKILSLYDLIYKYNIFDICLFLWMYYIYICIILIRIAIFYLINKLFLYRDLSRDLSAVK